MDGPTDSSSHISLTSWQIQSSELVQDSGEAVSQRAFDTTSWYPAQVPGTVLAALVAAGEYADPYVGTRLREIAPERFSAGWWFRSEFDLPADVYHDTVLLEFDGINYAAQIWLNGEQVGDPTDIRGAYRRFQLDVSDRVRTGVNVLAVQVSGPRPETFPLDLSTGTRPRPIGIWASFVRRVRCCGPVSIAHAFVESQVELATFQQARLTISAQLFNHSNATVHGLLTARIDSHRLQQEITLEPGQQQEAAFSPGRFSDLIIDRPRLWWPHDLGSPELYELDLEFHAAGNMSDQCHVTFGIRQVEDYTNDQGHCGFRINGRDVLVKAGGWSDDLLLADTAEKLEHQIGYVRQMRLNAIRLEGIWGCDDTLYDLCDRHGILMMVGWSCHWEHPEYLGRPVDARFGGVTSPDDIALISRCWTDQVLWLRNHPSIFVWTVASDKVPHPDLERKYVETFRCHDSTRPYLSSTGGVGSEQAIIGSEVIVSDVSGPTGVKMLGPYDYTPPVYWYEDTQRGGAYGFNTETSPGAVVPVWESVQRMIPAEHLWPIDDVWNYHCGLHAFSSLDRYRTALERRYGAVDGAEDFTFRAQVLNYELARPMFEAFRVHKGRATGVVHWMLNAAWPKMYWQLYDWYSIPTGAFYGTRKACAPVQLVYDYARRSVHLVNDTLQEMSRLRGEVTVFDLTARQRFSQEVSISAQPLSSQTLLQLPPLSDLTPTYFLRLRLWQSRQEIASNIYWLSTVEDQLDYGARVEPWEYYTPSKQYADYRALHTLPPAQVSLELESQRLDGCSQLRVTLANTGPSIAFFLELAAIDRQTGRRVVPVGWTDNYLTLFPGEQSRVETIINSPLKDVALSLQGWNVPRYETAVTS